MEILVISDSANTIGTLTNFSKNIPDAKMHVFKDIEQSEEILKLIGPKTLIILDWETIPANTGLVFLNKLRKFHSFKDVPVFAVISKPREQDIESESRNLMYGLIYKPIEMEQLDEKLTRALKPVGSYKTVDVAFINPFVAATLNVFETMAQTKAERKELFLKKDYKMFGDISGVMGLSGAASGSVVISLPSYLAKTLVGRMLNDPNVAESDVRDGIGEIINMISGQAKAALSETKHRFSLSIPTVVAGPGHEISHKKGTPCIVVVFQCENDKFAIQVSLAPADGK